MQRWLPPVLVALVAGLWLFLGDRDPGPPAVPESASASDTAPAIERPSLPLSAPAVAMDEPRVEVEAPAAPVGGAGPAAPGTARLTGRLVYADGAPAATVELDFWGSSAGAERVAEHGLPDDWTDQTVATDGDGRFELRFDPPPAFQFGLDVHVDGCVPLSWSWGELGADTDRDLGVAELARGGTLLVRVERPDGTPAGTDWRVHAAEPSALAGPRRGWGRDKVRRNGEFDAALGAWRITDLPPGAVDVAGYSPIANWISTPGVEVREGQSTDCTLIYSGPDNDRRIVVVVFPGRIYPILPEAAAVTLTGGPLTEPLVCEIEFGAQNYDFPDLEPGSYTVVIDDPAFDRFERSGVQPGERVDARLTGSAALRFEVVDRESGAPVEGWSLNLRCEGVNFGPSTFALVAKGSDPPKDGRFGSLAPLDYTALLEAPGYPATKQAVPDLASGEERLVRFELSRTGGIAGTARFTDGRPASDLAIEVYDAALTERSVDWWTIWGRDRLAQHFVDRTTTDAEGRYRVGVAAAGPFLVRAVGGSALHTTLVVEHDAGVEQAGVDFKLPVGATLVGRVLVPAEADPAGLVLRAGVAAETPEMEATNWDLGWDAFLERQLGSSGEFRLGAFDAAPLEYALLSVDGAVVLARGQVEPEGHGEFPLEIDLRETWPARQRVEVLVRGEPLDAGSIDLRPASDHVAWRGPRRLRLAADGSAEFEVPSGPYSLEVFSQRHGGWRWQYPGPVVVQAGRGTLTLDVPVARATLTLVEGTTGEPLSGVDVLSIVPRTEWAYDARPATTDARGAIVLERPPGDLWLRRAADRPSRFGPEEVVGLPQVTWTVAGPTVDRVALP